MSISGLLSKDTNDTDYSFQKPQKDSSNNNYGEGALGSRGGRSNLTQTQATDSADEKESEASISDANTDASLAVSDQSEGESSEEGPRSPSMIVPPPPRKIPEPGNGLVVKLRTNSGSRPPSVSSTRASQEPDTTSKVNLMSQVLQFPQTNQIERRAASLSSDSSADSVMESKTKRRSSESSDSSSESDTDIGEEERFSEELVNYMVEIYKRQKRVIDEYERRCRIKKDILRRKVSTRFTCHISENRIFDKENHNRSIRGIRHKMDIKRMSRNPPFDYSVDAEGGNDDQKRTFSTRIQKQREALESEERRRIWKDIVRNAIPRMNKIVIQTTTSRLNNCRKIALLCQKEARKAACKSCKSPKDIQTRARQAMRQMLFFWKRNEKEERELRKKAEREALERMRVEEEMREAKRQARKLNFLITQTELYSHFVGKKIGTQNAEENAENVTQVEAAASEQGTSDQGTESSPTDLNLEVDGGVVAPTSFEDIDFDEEDEDALREKARASAKNALAQVKKHTRDFDGDRSGKSTNIEVSNEDLDQMNFQNPSSMPSMSEIKQPSILVKVTLKDYQLKGLNWLANLYEQGINGILADEMGLGKTVQSISLMAHLAEIVQDQSYFARTKWQYMILDEAQAIKSSSSARWKTLLGFQCRNRLLLTGTPIQNSMQELWALLHFIMPTLFDSHQEFSEWFSKDIESHAENKGSLNEHQLKRLHMILKPFMLRRVKKNVQNELGEKIEREVFCNLTARQRILYRGLREKISVAELLEKAATLPDNDNVDSLMNLVMQFRLLNVPGDESQAGSRTNILDHMMNIWRPDYINQSLNDEQSGDETAPTLSPMNVESSPILSELTNIFENTTQYELVVLDMCYMPKAIAPPIQPVCVDKCFYNDQERLLFDSSIRTALFGIIELLPQEERMKSDVVRLLTQSGERMIGKTYRKDCGFSYMRVPRKFHDHESLCKTD
ncbi:15407_t:CDS:10 [Acaulospora colombiana]|uniref:15407_t:CDS:1 n=1 Tax=Acaulospora colombiana TaxID=27376 RepID=A0ACA9L4R4_9GLOM|nr:15407_t:CDS:10 [Acaulospora colombiana]